MSIPPVDLLPDLHADTPGLRDAARSLREKSRHVREHLDDAHSGWRGLRSAYHHNSTQERVWSGLDLLDEPVGAWVDAIGRAADEVLFRHRSLEILRPGVESERSAAISSEDPAQISSAMTSVEYFNGEVADLVEKWAAVQADFAAGIRGITGGEEDALPKTEGIAAPGRVDWDNVQTTVDADLKATDPEFIFDAVKDMSEEEFLEWVERNPAGAAALMKSSQFQTLFLGSQDFPGRPDLAEALVDNQMPKDAPEGSPEARLNTVLDAYGDVNNSAQGINEFRAVWDSLSEEEQSQLLLKYPNQLGNTYGLPLEQTATINAATVVGLHEQIKKQQVAHDQAKPSEEDLAAYEVWTAEQERLGINANGLAQAVEGYKRFYDAQSDLHDKEPNELGTAPPYRVLSVSTEAEGQISTIQGSIVEKTENVVAFTPGTFTDISSVDRYNGTVAALRDGYEEKTVGIYWADGEFPGNSKDSPIPDAVTTNATSDINTQDADRQATFDHAIDKEIAAAAGAGTAAKQTWVGHSAGASKQGTAEKVGLDADRILYMAPAGTGYGVDSPEDTASWDAATGRDTADRAKIQSRADPIFLSQEFGGSGFHSGNWATSGDPARTMDAKVLEPGYTADGQNVSRAGTLGHNGILEPGSTAMNNARAFVNGEPVVLKENAFTSSMRREDEKQWDDYEKSDYNEVWPE